MILKSLIARMRRQFNVSICETDGMDLWQKSSLLFAAAGRERTNVNQTLDFVLDYLDRERNIEIIRQEMELI